MCFLCYRPIRIGVTSYNADGVPHSCWPHCDVLYIRQSLRRLQGSTVWLPFSKFDKDNCLVAGTAQTRVSVCPVHTFCSCHLFPPPSLHNLQFNLKFPFIVNSVLYRSGSCLWSHIYQSNLHNIKKRILCTGFSSEAWFALARFGLIWHGLVF